MGDGRWATDANGHRQRPNHQRGKTEMAETPSPGSAGGTQLGHHHFPVQSSPVQVMVMVMVMGMARLMDVRKNLKQMLRRQSRKPRPTTHNPQPTTESNARARDRSGQKAPMCSAVRPETTWDE